MLHLLYILAFKSPRPTTTSADDSQIREENSRVSFTFQPPTAERFHLDTKQHVRTQTRAEDTLCCRRRKRLTKPGPEPAPERRRVVHTEASVREEGAEPGRHRVLKRMDEHNTVTRVENQFRGRKVRWKSEKLGGG